MAYKAAGAKAANGRRRWWDASGAEAELLVVELRQVAMEATHEEASQAPPPLLCRAYRTGRRASGD